MKLTEAQAVGLVYNQNPEYDLISHDVDYDTLFKDYANAEVVIKKKEDGTYWRFFYQSYESHYGSGEDTYYDCELVEVKKAIKTVEIEYWERKE